MSTSHPRHRQNLEEVDFAELTAPFDDEFGAQREQLMRELRDSYPEVTKPSRRTGRALRDICFFVWCTCRGVDASLIPTLFRAAVLLSAQDDYFDNARIPATQKETYCAAINHALWTGSFARDFQWSLQLRDLTALWSYVAGTIPRSAPDLQSYWNESACRLNDAMAAENRVIRRATITYEEYMRTAVDSIGMVFIWVTYLAHKRVPVPALHEIAPALARGALVVRLSNDVASWRRHTSEKSAVTLIGGPCPGTRILRIIVQESRAFRDGVHAMNVAPEIRRALLRSLDFLKKFYQRSDFGGEPVR